MAGTFTRSIFYKLDTSPNATVQYIGVNRTPSPYVYRISNAASAGTIYQGGGIAYSPSTSPTNRIVSPTGGSALSPTWPVVAGNTVLVYVQEGSPTSGAGTYSYSTATSSATIAAINIPVVNSTQSYSSSSPSATILHSPAFTTIGAGGTLEVNKTSPTVTTYPTTGWTSTSAFTVDRGAQYNIWARRGVGVLNEGQYANYTFVSTTVPYLGLSAAITSATIGGISTASPNAPYSVSPSQTSAAAAWTGTVAPGWYRVVRLSPAPTTVVIAEGQGLTSGSITNLPTSPGERWTYAIQVKRAFADGGGDTYGNVVPSTGQNPFYIRRASPTPTTLTIGTVTIDSVSTASKELTGNYSPNVSIGWTTTANHTYQIIRTESGSDVVVTAESASQPQSLIYSPAGDLPTDGVTASYTIQVRRPTANGGDNIWYDATGTNNPFSILRIQEPTVRDTQTFNTTSPTPISHTIELKTDGIGGTLEYGWNTTGTNSQASVTNWQSSARFNNAFTRGNTYYFYARRSTDRGDFDVSGALVIPPTAPPYGIEIYNSTRSKVILAPGSNPCNLVTCTISGVAATSVTVTGGTTSASISAPGITTSNGDTMFIYVYPLGGPPAFVSGWYTVNRGTNSFTISSNATATFYFFVGRIA